MSLLNDLARIREMNGLQPLPDPRVIAGFGPSDMPPPPYMPPTDRTPVADTDDDLETPPAAPPSPLIPRRGKPEPAPALEAPQVAPQFSLVVLDHMAVWKGRDVTLLPSEEGQVRGIVLQAIKRQLQADIDAAASLGNWDPKAEPALEPAPKKRGRPKKVQP